MGYSHTAVGAFTAAHGIDHHSALNQILMQARELQERLLEYTVAHSGHDPARDYLGMSQISREEDDLLDQLRGKQQEPSREEHLLLDLGHLFTHDIKRRLEEAFKDGEDEVTFDLDEQEIVADFDERFRGHADGLMHASDQDILLEVKAVTHEKLDQVRNSGRLPRPDYDQIQMYLAHSGLDEAHVIYVGRDTGEIYVHYVKPQKHIIDKLNTKAKRILERFDEEHEHA